MLLPRIPLLLSYMSGELLPSDSPGIVGVVAWFGCCGNVSCRSLPSNGCLFLVRYSGPQPSCHRILTELLSVYVVDTGQHIDEKTKFKYL
jgi:hypothetical protein